MFKIIISCLLVLTTLSAVTSTLEQNIFKGKIQENNFDKKEYLKKYLKSKLLDSFLSRNYTKKYYKDNNYELFWSEENKPKKIAYELLNSIKADPVLKPFLNKLFNLKKIEPFFDVNNTLSQEELIKYDILLTGTYYFYMHYLSEGIINWKKFQEALLKLKEKKEIIANWQKYNVRKNIRKLLYKAIEANNLTVAIQEVNFTFSQASKLKDKLLELEQLKQNGGYIKIPKINKSLRVNKEYSQIPFLRQRLLQTKDLLQNECIKDNFTPKEEVSVFQTEETKVKKIKLEINCENFYTQELFDAVKIFQKRHGLKEDGIVGKKTLAMLNETVTEKIKRIRLNLERMRWMPRTLGEKHIIVNIPDFRLKFYNKEKLELEMGVIVGQATHPTPIFSHRMSEIILNPYWRIPQRIVKNEIIPELIKDANYLVLNDINVYENWDHESMKYDVSAVDWSMYQDNDLIGTSKEAPMRFIQIPGKKNPLGNIKFLFPNKYSVYMHDTPFKGLFKESRRTFSHGCIRLENPHKLFETIASSENINIDEAKKTLSLKERKELDLKKKIPVHIVYITTWIDEEGKLQERDDIYNYDKIQGEILFSPTL